MGDPLWSTRFQPVMSEAISLLVHLLGGSLLEELLSEHCIELHHYEDFSDLPSNIVTARKLFILLHRKPEPSFASFCDVLLKLGGGAGQDLYRLLTPSQQLVRTTPSSCSASSSGDDEVTVFVDVTEGLEERYELHKESFVTALKDYLREAIPQRVRIVEHFPSTLRERNITLRLKVAKFVQISILFPNINRQRFKQEENDFVQYITRIMNIPKSDLELCIEDGSCIVNMTVPGAAFIDLMRHLGDCGILSVVCRIDAGALISFEALPWAAIGRLMRDVFTSIFDRVQRRDKSAEWNRKVTSSQLTLNSICLPKVDDVMKLKMSLASDQIEVVRYEIVETNLKAKQFEDVLLKAKKSKVLNKKTLSRLRELESEFLYWLATKGLWQSYYQWLRTGINFDVNMSNQEGITAIMLASEAKPHSVSDESYILNVLQHLVIKKGVDINQVDMNGMTPLLHAYKSSTSSFAVVQQLIELGHNVAATDNMRLSTRPGIVMASSKQTAGLCTESSRDKENDWDEEEEERLYQCVENGDSRNVKEILSSGKVDLSQVYRDKELICGEDRIMVLFCTLIHVAVLKREIEILKDLIRQGMEIDNASCYILKSASHYYFGEYWCDLTPLMLACVIGDMSAVEFLLDNGANTLSRTASRETALNLAFANGRVQIVERLMPEINDYELHEGQVLNDFPLFFSACFGGLKMVQLWLKIGKNEQTKREQLNPNYEKKTTDRHRNTAAIHWAVLGVQIDVIDWLCERGFQLSETNIDYWNVFHTLADSNHKEESDRIDLLAWLVRERLPLRMIDQVTVFEETPLSLACCSKNFRFARKLLEYGVEQEFDIEIGTALLRAVFLNGDQDVAKGIAELQIEFSGLGFLDKDRFVRDAIVFDSFVTEEVLVAGMPGVFHWAAFYGSEVSLDHLLRHGANVEEKLDQECTPIMHCETVEKLKWFVEHNANYQAVDIGGNSLLHLNGDSVSLLEYLLTLGLSLEAENYGGEKPHETATGEGKIFLRSKYEQMLSFRLDSERVQPECVQTCLVGEPMAGKTTLTNSLCGIAPKSDESDELNRTAGVDVHNQQVEGVGLMSIWDFGGQYPFRVAHAILFRFALTIFICVVNLDDGNGKRRALREVIAEVRRWLAFLKSARKSIVSGITIVVVGNKRTGDNPDSDMEPLDEFQIYIEDLVEKFGGIFRLSGVVELDCKKRRSPAMNSFRCELKRIREELIQKADPVPKVCENCRSLILNSSYAENKLLNLEEFGRTIEELLSRPLVKDSPVDLLAQNLHDSGTILYFRTLGQIYLQPSVLVTNLLGPILSDPKVFYIHAVDDDTGRVNRKNIEVALKLFQAKQRKRNLPYVSFSADDAIRVMVDLHLICQIEGKDGPYSYHVPCLIKELKPDGVWEKRDDMVVYRGRRYRVSHPETDVIPPPLFPVLQSRCAAISGYRMILWKNGFKLEASGQSHLVECLVKITNEDDCDAVDVIVRCSKGGECVAKDALEDVKRTVESVRGDKANGTPMEWCYLDSDDLENLSSKVAVYERDDVKSCKSSTAIVKARRVRNATYPCIRIIRLRLPRRIGDGEPEHGGRFPAADDVVCKDLIAAICSGASSKWEEICCDLLSAEAVTEIRRGNHSNKVSLALVLERWMRETEQPLVKKVLRACTESSINKRVIQEKYKKVTSFHS